VTADGAPQGVPAAVEALLAQHLCQTGDACFLYLLQGSQV
jgi:hypothetical protein